MTFFAWERGQHQTEINCSTCTQYIYHEVEKGGPSPPCPTRAHGRPPTPPAHSQGLLHTIKQGLQTWDQWDGLGMGVHNGGTSRVCTGAESRHNVHLSILCRRRCWAAGRW